MALGQSDSRVARALSAPTRAAILDRLRELGPLTAKEVAEHAGVHPNVARGHLDMLVEAGLAAHSWRRNPAGGRPAKAYEAVPAHVEEGTTLVAEMLAALIEETGHQPEPARRIAEQTGERLGRRARDNDVVLSFDEQITALLRALGEVSGGVRIADRGEDWVEFEDVDCPFKGIAAAHPELACSLDKSLKTGVMRALGAEAVVEVVTSVAWGDPSCREVVRVRGPINP
ncbi:MAG TPA: helix-turn-helix domain-containing protein [Actinomycetota bacterium]|nr:helix-turn-helix domain-containing protein [Actinomycetota bacterium]